MQNYSRNICLPNEALAAKSSQIWSVVRGIRGFRINIVPNIFGQIKMSIQIGFMFIICFIIQIDN